MTDINEQWLQTSMWVETTLENCRMLLREMKNNRDESRMIGYRLDALEKDARRLYHGESHCDDLITDVKAVFNFIMEKTK